MKKLLTKFTSIFLAVVVLMSCCCCVPVSATSEDALLTSFGSVPLDRKANFLTDDGYVYKYCFLVRLKGDYKLFMFGKKNYDSYIDDISYLDLSSNNIYFRNSDNSDIGLSSSYLSFNFDSVFNTSSIYGSKSFLNTGYYYSYVSSSVENFVDNIIYSDFPVKYNGLTVYDPSKNKHFTIEDFITLGGGNGGSDNNNSSGTPLYGSYVQKNEETLKAFCQWLIDTGKYTDLASYGFKVSSNNLYNVVDCWWDNKFSPALFWELFKTNGLNSISSASSVIGWFSARWSEYVSINNAVVEIPYSDSDNVNMHHRATDVTEDVTETVTDENGNTSTVVVQQKDTELLLVLREILRQVINLPSNVAKSTYSFFYSLVSNIADNVYSLCLSISTLPQSTADSIYNNLVNPFNSILDAINNSGSGSSTTENITNNYVTNNNYFFDEAADVDDYELLLSDYNQQYNDVLSSKLPFLSQIDDLFTEFFSLMSSSEQSTFSTYSTTLKSSFGPNQTTGDYIHSKMSSAFPAYNTNYLNDADISNAPDISVNVGGVKCQVVDFRIFAKYRTKIHAVILLFFWLRFLISLKKSIPGILAGVQDVINISTGDIISNSDFESNSIIESEQSEANKFEDFDVFVENADGTYSAYKSENGWPKG